MSERHVPHRDKSGALLRAAMLPQAFQSESRSVGAEVYLDDLLARKLTEFFEAKGLAAIKEGDRTEEWYEDWITYQAGHQLYARLLCPRELSTLGTQFDLLRYTRFLEVFAYFSPAHGYSLQVTFLGLFAILMGHNASLKAEAATLLEAGRLFALGVSERSHGSDLLANESVVRESSPGRLVCNAAKYYIGNANCAAIISMLARRQTSESGELSRRDPLVFYALRPESSGGLGALQKIRTSGVRSAFVGSFEVKNHELHSADVFAEGRGAWDAVFGTVTLGKFFLGFGSIGICERALSEAIAHLGTRILYGKPAIEMPHLRRLMAQSFARLTAMKLFAYRALDYVQAAGAEDRRYLLYTAVQKARVSTEGVRVMALISECVGAKGFESDTYMEMALRDAQLIPGLEGSTHINLGLIAQFIPRYFSSSDDRLMEPAFHFSDQGGSGENPYLYIARSGALHTIAFPEFRRAYVNLRHNTNVAAFAGQAEAISDWMLRDCAATDSTKQPIVDLALGQCMATIAYGQLIAEHAVRLNLATEIVSVIFGILVGDLSSAALNLAGIVGGGQGVGSAPAGAVVVPMISDHAWGYVGECVKGMNEGPA